LALDVYVPEFGGPYPAVLAAAGGGWNSDDKDDWYDEGIYLAESGFVAFVADHSLAPPGGTQHANQPAYDLLGAMSWVRANAPAYNAIPDKVGPWGEAPAGNWSR
jgi:acetyl esterase/lipase